MGIIINLIIGIVFSLAGVTSLLFTESLTTVFVYYTSLFITILCAVNILKVVLGKKYDNQDEEGDAEKDAARDAEKNAARNAARDAEKISLIDKISVTTSVAILVLAVINLIYMASSVSNGDYKGNWLYVSVIFVIITTLAAAGMHGYSFLSCNLKFKIVGFCIIAYTVGISIYEIITLKKSVEQFGNTLAVSMILVGVLYMIASFAESDKTENDDDSRNADDSGNDGNARKVGKVGEDGNKRAGENENQNQNAEAVTNSQKETSVQRTQRSQKSQGVQQTQRSQKSQSVQQTKDSQKEEEVGVVQGQNPQPEMVNPENQVNTQNIVSTPPSEKTRSGKELTLDMPKIADIYKK